MGAVRRSTERFTEAEYFAFESASPTKHEFFRGEVFAMAGNSFAHVTIATNVSGELRNRLRSGPCRPFESNLRIKIEQNSLITYPDVSVFCAPVQIVRHEQGEAATNPSVLIEILSPSTASYDRGSKFELYREIPSLQAYVLISQSEAAVEVFTWDEEGVKRSEFLGLDAVARIEALGIDLPLAEIYEDVDLSATAAFRVLEETAV